MEYEVKDRNEWFEEVERAYSKLKIEAEFREMGESCDL